MDEWEAERDWRDDAVSRDAHLQAPAGLLGATLLCTVVALDLAIFVAPSAKREARELAAQAQAGFDQMATGSIHRSSSAGREPIARNLPSKADRQTCQSATVEGSEMPC